jgi:hypothetical protein
MSTPYVGLKRVVQKTRPEGQSPWVTMDAEESGRVAPTREEAKARLIRILESQLGVQTLQVGAFQMKLGPEVPERHLLKASYYLVQQMKEEAEKSPLIETLEECLIQMLRA